MFWTGFFIGFATCLAIGLTAHFVHDRRQRAAFDLSPNFHPPISRVPVTFEPNGLGEATGRGAEPPA
jgi:hypothetical protein